MQWGEDSTLLQAHDIMLLHGRPDKTLRPALAVRGQDKLDCLTDFNLFDCPQRVSHDLRVVFLGLTNFVVLHVKVEQDSLVVESLDLHSPRDASLWILANNGDFWGKRDLGCENLLHGRSRMFPNWRRRTGYLV